MAVAALAVLLDKTAITAAVVVRVALVGYKAVAVALGQVLVKMDMAAMEPFVLFGPVLPVSSHQQIQGMYK